MLRSSSTGACAELLCGPRFVRPVVCAHASTGPWYPFDRGVPPCSHFDCPGLVPEASLTRVRRAISVPLTPCCCVCVACLGSFDTAGPCACGPRCSSHADVAPGSCVCMCSTGPCCVRVVGRAAVAGALPRHPCCGAPRITANGLISIDSPR